MIGVVIFLQFELRAKVCLVLNGSQKQKNWQRHIKDSYLTITASRAQKPQHGFLFDFQVDTVHYEIKAERPRDKDVSEDHTFHATFQINHRPSISDPTLVDSRTWCLQEWYLPKRIVELCLNDIRFLCLRSVETRSGRTNENQHLDANYC